MKLLTRTGLLAITLCLAGAAHGAGGRVVLAVPAQHALVNLAFDLAGFFPRDLEIVCHDARKDGTLTLEVFDRASWRWQPLTDAAWAGAQGLRGGAERLVVVGPQPVAERLVTAPWVMRSQTIDGHRLHEVANAVNRELPLSPEQWKKLASAYGFKIEDRNAEARRQGRYGRPRTPPAPAGAAGDVSAPLPEAVLPREEPAPAPEVRAPIAPMADVEPVVVTEAVAPATRPEDK